MTTSTSDVRLPGVDRHRDRWRVRKSFPAPHERWIEFYDTLDEANMAALELERRRKAGLPPRDAAQDAPLGDLSALLFRRKTAEKLAPSSLRFWKQSLAPWHSGEYATTPLSMLRRAPVEDYLLDRAVRTPRAARHERQALISVLNLALDRGYAFDLALLRIPPIAVVARPRRALTAAELEWLAAHTPAHSRRLVLTQGTVGNRIGELWAAEPAHFDAAARTLFVPAANCKERVDKWIPLTTEEVVLFSEQTGGLQAVTDSATSGLPVPPASSPRLFMTPGYQAYSTGRRRATEPRPWTREVYSDLVWQPAIRQAAAAWRAEHDLADVMVAGRMVPAPTPFEWYVDPATEPVDGRYRDDDDGRRWLTTHDLRSTAVTLMRDAGMSRDACAARVGHADDGKLIASVYDKGDRFARAGRALAAAAPDGLRALLVNEPAGRRPTSSIDAASSTRNHRS